MLPPLTKRVLLLGWDAADWKIIHPLLERDEMPTLKRLIETGVSGNLATLQPVLSPILWNSIATGKYADKHQILGFTEPSPDGAGVRPIRSTARRAKAIWNILSQHGRRSGVVNWFASHPAEPIDGLVFTNQFPEIVRDEAGTVLPLDAQAVHPPSLFELAETLRVLPRHITAEQLRPFFPERVPADTRDPRLHMLIHLLAECASVQNAATFLLAGADCELVAVYYETIDHACHGFMEYHPPAMEHVSTEDAAAFQYVITGIYRLHDMLLGRLLQLAGPDTTVLIISDHGFQTNKLRPPVKQHSVLPRDKFGGEINPMAWHRQQGIFIAAGPAIRRDELLHGANLLDIAPTVLTLLGLPVPDDMDGHALLHILQDPPSQLARVASYEEPHPSDGVHRDVALEETDPWAARQALEQLAALGYIELPEGTPPAELLASTLRDRSWNLAQVYLSTRRPELAEPLLRAQLAERDAPSSRCSLALCLLALRRPEDAVEMVVPLQTLEEFAPMARLIKGQATLLLNDTAGALRLLEPLAEDELRLPRLSVALGQTYLRCGLLPEAEKAFRRALERDEDDAQAHDGLGVVLRRQKRYEDAIYEHMRAAALEHQHAQTHINLGIALAKHGQADWAIRAFETAAWLAPDHPFPQRCLARMYFSVKKDRERARFYGAELLRLRRARREREKQSAPATA